MKYFAPDGSSDSYNYKNMAEIAPGAFVGVMHTSDIIGDPEGRFGNVDVYTNGGRLQPGCYNNEEDIHQC